jgi:hypothetical protein
MSGNDEENLFVAPRRPARRTNRACRHSALTIVLAKNAEAILKLAGMFLCQYQASLLMTCSVLVALILSSRNNAPHIVLQRLRILLTATIALCAHSLHSTRSLLRTARELLFVRRNERQRQDNAKRSRMCVGIHFRTRFGSREHGILTTHTKNGAFSCILSLFSFYLTFHYLHKTILIGIMDDCCRDYSVSLKESTKTPKMRSRRDNKR